MSLTPEQMAELQRRRRGRNIALALLLGGFVVLFFLITIARIKGAQ